LFPSVGIRHGDTLKTVTKVQKRFIKFN
jgi:hypothetical protein